jgi:hypothetical protein
MNWGTLLGKGIYYHSGKDTIIEVNEPVQEYNVNIKTTYLTIINKTPLPIEHESNSKQFDYIIGNPPFIGKSQQTQAQKEDLEFVFLGVKGTGVLDYVAAWYLRAAQLIANTKSKAAFVSTNSITQGEQVGVLWNVLFNFYKIKIHFAHQSFKWSNEAKAKAAVHCVIIGFANYDTPIKRIFSGDNDQNVTEIKVNNINPYLFEGRDLAIQSRSKPLCNVPKMVAGNKAIDGGNFIFTNDEKERFLEKEPLSATYFRQFIGSEEFINNHYCPTKIG